mgnify:CR=1 FL=1
MACAFWEFFVRNISYFTPIKNNFPDFTAG